MDRDSIAAFYELARDMTSIERDRFEQAEGKAWRHLYVLVVLLGFALASSGRTALDLIVESLTIVETAYVVAFGLFLLTSFAAGLVSLWNFRVALTLEPPLDQSLEQFATGSSIARFHLELGREFIRAAAENRRVAERKFRLLIWNFRLLVAALSFGVVVGVLFLLLPRES